MGIIKAAVDAVKGGFADQWLEVIQPLEMSDTTVMSVGVNLLKKIVGIIIEKELTQRFRMDRLFMFSRISLCCWSMEEELSRLYS